jgi:hypothetical protein
MWGTLSGGMLAVRAVAAGWEARWHDQDKVPVDRQRR